MHSDRFKELLDELDGNSLQTLKEKNARYAKDGDCLHNFRSGAEIMGKTPAQACWGYMTKHLTALRDKIDSNDFSDREDFLEKCQDTINYIRFLWCIGNDNTGETTEAILRDCFGQEHTITLFSNQEQSTREYDAYRSYVFMDKKELEHFKMEFNKRIAKHGFITVADVYEELIGMEADYHKLYKIGWTKQIVYWNDEEDEEIYRLTLPEFEEIKVECEYETTTHPYGYVVCLGTKEKDLCPGHNKCDRYRPKNNKK